MICGAVGGHPWWLDFNYDQHLSRIHTATSTLQDRGKGGSAAQARTACRRQWLLPDATTLGSEVQGDLRRGRDLYEGGP